MEHKQIASSMTIVASVTTISSFIRVCRKLTNSRTVYAGLLVFFVPSVFCESDWSRHLTFDQIYNNTNYAQIQNVQRPYNHAVKSFNNNNVHSREISEGNDINKDYIYRSDVYNKEKHLVGFARDPFRYSVPEEDYLKGVRTIDPQLYENKGDNRGKRGVVHLYNMMLCATGCEPLSYKGYGCYCGFLGSGRPIDGIDRCCKMHDDCYENIYCPFYTVYFQPYYWKCYRGQPLCALENYQTQHQFVNACAARLCECDRQFAMCVKRYHCPRRGGFCRSSPIRLLQNILMYG